LAVTPIRWSYNNKVIIQMAMVIPGANFFLEYKEKTERYWIMHPISGFQAPRGSFWNPGLSEVEILNYENFLGTSFPTDYREMLGVMNGTTTPNFDYSAVEPFRLRDVYSYPRDLATINAYIEILNPEMSEIIEVLSEQGYYLEAKSKLLPIYSHRYLVCSDNNKTSVVLSIMGTDAIVYGASLAEYLLVEFLPKDKRG
jgi:hypothetical protein